MPHPRPPIFENALVILECNEASAWADATPTCPLAARLNAAGFNTMLLQLAAARLNEARRGGGTLATLGCTARLSPATAVFTIPWDWRRHGSNEARRGGGTLATLGCTARLEPGHSRLHHPLGRAARLNEASAVEVLSLRWDARHDWSPATAVFTIPWDARHD